MIKISPYDPVTRFDLARTVLGRGRYWTTAYLVDGMLVDSGCAHAATELLRALEGTPLTCLVNTHTHEDHIGANGPLQRERLDLEILAHPAALPVLADPRHAQPLQLYRRFFWGWPEASQAQPLEDGQVIETRHHRFRVIHTPGHSPDHLCLYESERGWLFTGDLFIGGRDRALRAGYDIWEIIASLKRVAVLPAERLFPGSARVREEPRSALQTKIDYLVETGQKVLDLRRKGWSVKRIMGTVCGGPMWIEWVTWGHFSRRHLVESYLRGNVSAFER
jgi:glyoxylase-like metal-dependent hydrolase (beta-lactamase superfamily II)